MRHKTNSHALKTECLSRVKKGIVSLLPLLASTRQSIVECSLLIKNTTRFLFEYEIVTALFLVDIVGN